MSCSTLDDAGDYPEPMPPKVKLRQLPNGPRSCDLDYKGTITITYLGRDLDATGRLLVETLLADSIDETGRVTRRGATSWRGEATMDVQIPVGTLVYVIAGSHRGVAVVDFATPHKISFQDATPA